MARTSPRCRSCCADRRHPKFFHLGIGAPQTFDVSDQQIAATISKCEREEKRATFDLKPTIAGHQSLPSQFGGHGTEPVIGPRSARTRWRLCPPYAVTEAAVT